MRMRLEATTRSPESSSILVMAPVRLRRVASGLMIEKVRVAAITGLLYLGLVEFEAPPSCARACPQPSRLLLPASVNLRPVSPVHAFPAGQQLPGEPRPFESVVVEQVETAIVGQCRPPPRAVGDQHIARLVGSVGAGRQQDGLPCI